jgi:hypothetical protein
MERHPWAPPGALAQSLSALAHRDLLRCENEQRRLPGILGILLARAREHGALPVVDGGNGTLDAAETEKPITADFADSRGSMFHFGVVASLVTNAGARARTGSDGRCDQTSNETLNVARSVSLGVAETNHPALACASPSMTLTSAPLPTPSALAAAARLATISR